MGMHAMLSASLSQKMKIPHINNIIHNTHQARCDIAATMAPGGHLMLTSGGQSGPMSRYPLRTVSG